MFCPSCGSQNPNDAHYCMFCATRLDTQPVTGPTTRLATKQPAAGAAAALPRHQHRSNNMEWPIFLIGLAILFSTNFFWPGILLLVGVLALVNNSGRDGMQGLVFFGGLALLFVTGLWWPGILLWLAATSLVGSKGHGWRC